VLMGEFGGASGTLSSLEKGAMETQAGLMKASAHSPTGKCCRCCCWPCFAASG
jgi:hypothetical protein